MPEETEPIRVLHVDDEPELAELVAEFLERDDDRFAVETVTAAGEGRDLLAEGDFDCIVSDYDMPGQDGIEFLSAVREDHPDLPFILYTGKGSEEVASDAISAGVTDYLQKTYGTGQYTVLANRIRNAVESHRAKREVELSERRLRRVYERITDGFFGVNADWEYTYVNDAAARIVDRSREELLGSTVWDAFPDVEGTPFEDALRTAMESQETTSVEEYYPPIDIWADVTVYPDEDGISVYFQDVTERKEREREREMTIGFLRRLYDVATDVDQAPREKITRLLEEGPEQLGLPYGHLTRIEVDDERPGGGTQTVIEASGDHELLQPGDSAPLSRSYCRSTIESDDLFVVQNALEEGWVDNPAYEAFKLGCYIGTSVAVDGELYGTVFFASAEPREEPFTEAERTFVRLMSQLVAYELALVERAL